MYFTGLGCPLCKCRHVAVSLHGALSHYLFSFESVALALSGEEDASDYLSSRRDLKSFKGINYIRRYLHWNYNVKLQNLLYTISRTK